MLAFVTCDSLITEPGAEKVEYTYSADGQKFVTVKINTSGIAGSSRALSTTIAQEAANYVEVIFKDGSNFYKAEGNPIVPLTISLRVTTYTQTSAVMLIGKRTGTDPDYDYTLLATGKLDKTYNLNDGHTDITFNVTGLIANLSTENNDSGAPTDDDRSFKITSNHGDFDGEFGIFHDLSPSSCFLLPVSNGITASLTIGGLNTDLIFLENGKTSWSGTNVNDEGVVKFNEFPGGTAAVSTKIDSTWFTAEFDNTDTSNKKCVFKFGISTTATGIGFYTITFDIPVFGLSNTSFTTSDGQTSNPWKIRGGTNKAPDFTGTSTGWSVAIRVANTVIEGQSKDFTTSGTW